MLVHKAFKFRLYPNHKQRILLAKTMGCVRFVFNYFLAKQKQQDAMWRTVEDMVQNGQLQNNNWKGDFFNKYKSVKGVRELKQHYAFLKEVDSIALQKSVENLSDAYSRYYKKQSRTPRFKSKRNPVQSYTTKYTNGNIAIEGNQLKLPKLGWVRFAKSREVNGRLLNATIRRNPSGNYYVSLVAETEVFPLPKTGSSVGIDMGLKDLAILSDGSVQSNQRSYTSLENKLKRAQRVLSRRRFGSSNYDKQRRVVARLHEKIHNKRWDTLHKLSTMIIKNHDVIGIEDLKVSNLLKNPKLAKSISDASWHTLRTLLTYKATWYGKEVIAIAKSFPSSQRCSVCGYQNKAVKDLAIRDWTCPSCHMHHDRDNNASQNILQEAMRLQTVGTTGIA